MIYDEKDQAFIESLANTDTGRDLIRLLENIERFYADIRNLDGVDAKVRIDALDIIKKALLDKLKILRGELQEVEDDEFT